MKAQTKITAVILIALATSPVMAHPFKPGTYKGQGAWKSVEMRGTYKTQVTISEKNIQALYTMADGSVKDWNFELSDTAAGQFNVMSSGLKVGQGYCLDHASVCHYDITEDGFKLEETIVEKAGEIYRYGSKDSAIGTVVWEEAVSLN